MKENKNINRPAARVPLKVLSTSLGLAIAAHMLLSPGLFGESAAYADGTDPKLVEWSNDEVKKYFNPSLDWSLPLNDGGTAQASPSASPSPGAGGTGSAGTAGTGSSSPVIIQQGGGFGWDDLLIYHLLFNRGGSYSASSWHDSHPAYDPRTKQPYQPKTYSSGTFQNKQVPGSNVKPKTSVSSGTFTTKQGASASSAKSSSSTSSGSGSSTKSSTSSSGKSTSSSSGSIGGKSGGFSGSSSSGS